jgi:hypothetical protein
MDRDFWLPVTIIFCGIPGLLAILGGILVTLIGLLANTRQLKLDTNLDRQKVIYAGLIALIVGLALFSFPLALFLKQ